MSEFIHCNPCNDFDYCPVCEQETCQTCGESIDSPHMHLNDEAWDKLIQLVDDDMMMPGRTCNECVFYAHHDINNPEQANYNHGITFRVEEYTDGKYGPFHGMMYTQWRKRIIVTGRKPMRTFPTIRGPFRIMPPKDRTHE